MEFGKFFSVQTGICFGEAIGLELYDSVRSGMIGWKLQSIPIVPDSNRGFLK